MDTYIATISPSGLDQKGELGLLARSGEGIRDSAIIGVSARPASPLSSASLSGTASGASSVYSSFAPNGNILLIISGSVEAFADIELLASVFLFTLFRVMKAGVSFVRMPLLTA